MGLARVLLDITAILLFIFVGIPLIVLLLGIMSPVWAGLYGIATHTLGPANPLTQLIYFLYQLSQYSHQYLLSGSTQGSTQGTTQGTAGGGSCV